MNIIKSIIIAILACQIMVSSCGDCSKGYGGFEGKCVVIDFGNNGYANYITTRRLDGICTAHYVYETKDEYSENDTVFISFGKIVKENSVKNSRQKLN